ncbi:hypothetical protein D3C86_1310290 [compost metagenome]
MRSLNVAQVVAHVNATIGGKTGFARGMLQRQRMRLGMGRGVAADKHGAVAGQIQKFDDGQRQVSDFIGDDSPRHAPPADIRQQFLDAGEQLAVHGGVGCVIFQELQARRLIVRVARRQIQGHPKQAARALRRDGAQGFERHGLQTAAGTLLIGGGGQVGGGVGQCAVEIEQNQGAHLRVAIR